MGNTIIIPCFCSSSSSSSSAVKLISYGGATRILTGRHLAGEIMFEFPDHMVCPADSFFIGHPIPSLAIDHELIRGRTYFLLPLDCVAHNVLSASTLAALGSDPGNKRGPPVRFKECPFEYVKGADGRVSIKVVPEFITRLISRGINDGSSPCTGGGGGSSSNNSFLCSTPELQKHYNQLVGSRDQIWSPKLDTISEYKIRFSPCRFIGLEWKQKEADL